MTKRKIGLWITGLVLLIVLIDQMSKIYVKTHFALYEQVEVFTWFKLYFIENDGMAFGLDFLGTAPLACFRIIAIIAVIYYIQKLIKRGEPFGMICCLGLIVAGALGNLIDNLFYGEIFSESLPYYTEAGAAQLVDFGEGYGQFLSGKVVDMLYFPLFTWHESLPWVGGEVFFGAIFNFADAMINCGAVALLLFYHGHLFHSSSVNEEAKEEE